MLKNYPLGESIKLFYYLVLTKFFYRKARLIRRPFYIRSKNLLSYQKGFTVGRYCRFDLGNGISKKGKTLIFGTDCKIGDRIHIVASQKVLFGNNCLVASNVFISDTSHGKYNELNQSTPESFPDLRELSCSAVVIGDRVWIGENVAILPGVTIGNGVIIGANTVVTKNVPNNSIYVGNPGKVIKKFNKHTNQWERINE